MIYIYGLCEPNTGEIRYVGQSTDPRARLANHMSGSASAAVRDWLDELGREPLLVILGEAGGPKSAAELEGQFIAQFARPRLLNAQTFMPRPVPVRVRQRKPRVMAFGAELLRRAIEQRGWSLSEAEQYLGLSRGYVSRLLRGRRTAGRDVALKLEREFGIGLSSWTEAA